MNGSYFLSWDLISSNGPRVAFAAGCCVGQYIYIHGGVPRSRSTQALSTFYRFSLTDRSWEMIEKPGSPTLSHHCAITVADRYILLIGGWDGKSRESQVYVFDTELNNWVDVDTFGFPVGAGLSSHTANLLSDESILVIGREGSLRTQRRSGNAFILSGSIAKKAFVFRDFPMGVASRSGHTTTLVNNTAVVVGGRSDKPIEIHRLTNRGVQVETSGYSLLLQQEIARMPKPPAGRKNHSAVNLGDKILIYGGETFDGRNKEPVSNVYLIDTKSAFTWHDAGKTNIGRAGHICVATVDYVYIHGGIGEGNRVYGGTYVLKLTKS